MPGAIVSSSDRPPEAPPDAVPVLRHVSAPETAPTILVLAPLSFSSTKSHHFDIKKGKFSDLEE